MDSPSQMSGPPPASSWAAPPEYYIDENLAGRTVRRLISDLGYVVHTPPKSLAAPALKQSLRDEDWLPVVGRNAWAVFGRDHHILERELELQAYKAAKVHMFLLPGQALRAEIVALLELNLSGVCTAAVERRPNVYWLTKHGLEDYELRKARQDRQRERRRKR